MDKKPMDTKHKIMVAIIFGIIVLGIIISFSLAVKWF